MNPLFCENAWPYLDAKPAPQLAKISDRGRAVTYYNDMVNKKIPEGNRLQMLCSLTTLRHDYI